MMDDTLIPTDPVNDLLESASFRPKGAEMAEKKTN
jgi:hypothetical protein